MRLVPAGVLAMLLVSCEGEPGSLPQPFSVVTPEDDDVAILVTTPFEWEKSTRALTYKVTIGTDDTLASVLFEQNGLTGLTYTPPGSLPMSTTIYWQVVAFNEKGSTVSKNAPAQFNT